MVLLAGIDTAISFGGKGIPLVVPTACDGEEVCLPGDDVEHAPNCHTGECAVEATQAEVDGVKGRCDSERCERRQVWVLGVGSPGASLPALKPPMVLNAQTSFSLRHL